MQRAQEGTPVSPPPDSDPCVRPRMPSEDFREQIHPGQPLPAVPHNACTRARSTLERMNDKWSVLVVSLLDPGPRRFNELRRSIGTISQRMLTLTLRNLERDGLVARKVFPTVPPQVEYTLTDLGRSMLEPIRTMSRWAADNYLRIEQARDHYDARPKNDADAAE